MNNASPNHRKILAVRTGRPVNGGRLLTRCAPVLAVTLLAQQHAASAGVLDGAPANLSARVVEGAVVLPGNRRLARNQPATGSCGATPPTLER